MKQSVLDKGKRETSSSLFQASSACFHAKNTKDDPSILSVLVNFPTFVEVNLLKIEKLEKKNNKNSSKT